jgi:hypothetical protein
MIQTMTAEQARALRDSLDGPAGREILGHFNKLQSEALTRCRSSMAMTRPFHQAVQDHLEAQGYQVRFQVAKGICDSKWVISWSATPEAEEP